MVEVGKWAYSQNQENYEGAFDSKEEAIEEAKSEGAEGLVWIGQLKEVKPSILGYQICEQLHEHAYEEVGEYADSWLCDISREDESELTQRLTDEFYKWAKEKGHLPKYFWGVENIERIDLSEVKK